MRPFALVQYTYLLGTQVISKSLFTQVFARGDTSTPSGLYARLCHTFLVDIFCEICRFLLLMQRGAFVSLVISGVTRPIFIKLAPHVDKILQLNIF